MSCACVGASILKFPKSGLGFWVGYHKMIDRYGRIYTARLDETIGSHTLNGWNTKSIGICLDGNFNIEAPTQAQLMSLRSLIKQYRLPYKFHWELDGRRTCAGFYFTHALLKVDYKLETLGEKNKCEQIKEQLSITRRLLKKLYIGRS